MFWIERLRKRRAGSQQVRASGARYAAGRPGKKTNGFASAVIRGTPLTQEVSAPRAFTSGLRRSASRAADGQRTRSGMRLRER